MIPKIGETISRVFRRVMPDPFTIAVLLTALVAILALAVGTFPARGGGPPAESLGERARVLFDAWRGESGIWSILPFTMQMCLILITGHALAASRPVARVIGRLAEIPRSTAHAAAMVGAAACVSAVINWGLGLLVGALLAREVGRSMTRRGLLVHYPLIVAAGYTALMVWHGGLSGSAPLSCTTEAGIRKALPAASAAVQAKALTPLSETIFSAQNLVITAGLLILTPLMLWLLAPRAGQEHAPMPRLPEARPEEPASEESGGMPDRLDRSWVVSGGLAVAIGAAVVRHIATRGAMSIGLNEVIGLMLAIGLLAHGSLRAYAAAAEEAARGCAGIILQFPLYGGIIGMMIASGLVEQLANWITRVSTPGTLPLFTFLSAALLNLAIPSGGGQWGIQGPIALQSAIEQNVPSGDIILAVAYGDQMTNMLQPFWALPLLAVTGVKAKDIVGYTAVVMVVGCAWVGLMLLVM